jgi:hypothetical protein
MACLEEMFFICIFAAMLIFTMRFVTHLSRIQSYTAPEDALDTPSQAADAARVIIRRALRDKLNTELPETAPINKVLGDNLEVRSLLRKRFGDIAYDSDAATAQHASEFAKGQKVLANERAQAAQDAAYKNDVARVARNRKIAGTAAKVAGYGTLATVGGEAIKHLIE